MENHFEETYEDLDEEDKKELNELSKELEKFKKEKPNNQIKNKKLKKRVAKICLKLLEETSKSKESIMKTSYIITGNFAWFNFEDDLNKAIEIAGELELPEEHVSGNVFKMWEKMKERFKKILSE